MKKIYIFIFILLFAGLNSFSQTLTKLSKERAAKIALQKEYNEEETTRFIERATTTGVNLSPRNFSNKIPTTVNSVAVNLDFELQDFTGWTGFYGSTCGSSTPNPPVNSGINFTTINNWNDEHGILNDTSFVIMNGDTIYSVCPFSGLASCRLGGGGGGCGAAYLSQTFLVTDTSITVNYAAIVGGGHPNADGAMFSYKIKTGGGILLDSIYLVNIPNGYCNWTSRTTSLKNYVGQNITIDFVSSDCDGGAHSGWALIDVAYGIPAAPCGFLPQLGVCLVTTDSNNHNQIYFNHSNYSVALQGTTVFRKNTFGTWDSLGTVPASQPDKFIDYTAWPSLSSYTYCVAATDSCKNNYAKSNAHGTINLQSNITGTGQINLSWNAYSGLIVNKYHIYRGNSPSTMSFIAQVSSSTFTYTDVNPPIGNDYYKIAIVAPVNCSSNAPHDTIIESNYIFHPITCNNSVLPTAVCFVTTSDSLHNEVYFNHGGGGLRYTIVYRQNALSNWDSIGFVAAAMPDKYIDLGVNPNQQAYTYCVEEVDSCGNKHGKTPAHTTILMQSSLGTGTQINLSWNAYVGMPIASYYIFRGPTPFTMTLLAQVSMSTLAYTDLTPPAGPNYYKIGVLAPTNCTSNATHDTLVGSNYKWNGVNGMGTFNKQELFNVYPNPANGIMNLELRIQNGIQFGNYEVRIMNVVGEEVIRTSKIVNRTTQIDLSDLQNGVYFISVKTVRGVVTKKIIVQH